MEADVDIGTLPILELFRYRNSSNIGMRGFSPTYFVPILE